MAASAKWGEKLPAKSSSKCNPLDFNTHWKHGHIIEGDWRLCSLHLFSLDICLFLLMFLFTIKWFTDRCSKMCVIRISAHCKRISVAKYIENNYNLLFPDYASFLGFHFPHDSYFSLITTFYLTIIENRSKTSSTLLSYYGFFLLSGFSFTGTDNSQGCRGREGTIFYSTLPLPPAHEHSDIYL